MLLIKKVITFVKSIFLCFLFILPLICFSENNEAKSKNLVVNGGFEETHGGLPSAWEPNGWLNDPGVTKYSIISDFPHSGKTCALIENLSANDSRFMQLVNVKPNTVYRMSCWMRAENIDSKNTGASITVLLSYYSDHSPELRNTCADWQFIEYYVRTMDDQSSMIVVARLGNFGETNTGRAYFDDFALEEITDPPEGVYISQLTKTGAQKKESRKAVAEGKPAGIPFGITLTFAFMFAALVCLVYFFFIRENKLKMPGEKPLVVLFAFILGIALAARIFIALTNEGYFNDVQAFRAWAVRASSVQFNHFYVGNLFADYPPGYMYVLAAVGHIGNFFALNVYSSLYVLLLKLPSIIADIITCLLIFAIIRKKAGIRWAFGLSALYAVSPGIIFTSAFWGQVDSIAALLVLLVIYFIMEDRFWLSSLILGFAILVKIQTGFLVFILLFALIRKKKLSAWLASAGCGLLTFSITVAPFIPENESIFWIAQLATRTITQYPYASVNAFNLMGLFGGNWQPVDGKLFFLRYSTWGYIFGGIILASITVFYFTLKNGARNYLVSFAFLTSMFLFMPIMHERYIYPALLLALMSFVYTKKTGMFILFAGYSVTYFINIAYVNDFFIRGKYIFGGDAVLITISIINLLLVSYPAKLMFDSVLAKIKEIRSVKRETLLDPATETVD